MIVSKSQSQATLPDERRSRLTLCKTGDGVLYHSLPILDSLSSLFFGWLNFRVVRHGGGKVRVVAHKHTLIRSRFRSGCGRRTV